MVFEVWIFETCPAFLGNPVGPWVLYLALGGPDRCKYQLITSKASARLRAWWRQDVRCPRRATRPTLTNSNLRRERHRTCQSRKCGCLVFSVPAVVGGVRYIPWRKVPFLQRKRLRTIFIVVCVCRFHLASIVGRYLSPPVIVAISAGLMVPVNKEWLLISENLWSVVVGMGILI